VIWVGDDVTIDIDGNAVGEAVITSDIVGENDN